MSKFSSVEFDFVNGKVKPGAVWHHCVNVLREEIESLSTGNDNDTHNNKTYCHFFNNRCGIIH